MYSGKGGIGGNKWEIEKAETHTVHGKEIK